MADMDVYIYPNTSSDDQLARDAKNGLQSSLSDICIAASPDMTYNVDIDYRHPNVGTSSRKNFYNNFSDWNNINYVGCHLGVSNDISGGLADGGNSSNPEDDAFIDQKDAVAGSGASNDTTAFQAIVTQEVLHTFIDKALCTDLTGDVDDEHALGDVYSTNYISPMAYTYNGQYEHEGECSGSYAVNDVTNSPTSCTKTAVERTAEDEGFN